MTPATITIDRIAGAAEVIGKGTALSPGVGVIAEEGLAGLTGALAPASQVAYHEVPGFLPPAGEASAGRVFVGALDGVGVAVLAGRSHRYQGYPLSEITFPVRVLRRLGVETLIVTGGCAALHPSWAEGELVVISDHINLLGDNPLVGANVDSQGPRFPDMTAAYDQGLRSIARQEAQRLGASVREGVVVAVTGPSLETAAEAGMLRTLGADMVETAMVAEVIVARHSGMRVLGLSVVGPAWRAAEAQPASAAVGGDPAEASERLLEQVVRAVIARL